ncbi:arabinose transporter [Chitinophaga pendula]|uniref:MFS transporter n=1 Tax=Chitinophaga pendula TaxID=2849666 RepID=UPI001CECBE7A|nr:MFS transporter [Chitinophaga pendula]UCJ09080.1 arabinose transporter [Chitinophaga pendula]
MSERNTLTLPVTQNDKTDAAFFSIIVPIIISVFAIYLTIGMMLGVLPAFIKSDLKYGSLAVGIVIGIQSLATLLTRASAGKMTDTRGARASSYTGISLVMVSGILYLAVATFSQHRSLALGMILLARIVHGVAESMSVTGALTWGIGLVGIQKSGKVMTWNGIAMYAGIAIGAPLAIWMKETQGITYVFGTILALSVISWLSTTKLPDLPVDKSHIRTPFYKVIGVIAGQGLGLAFASIGFACISSFIALLFAERNWGNPSMAFMAFGMFYVLTRVFFSSFPDKYGGYQVALFSLFIEVIGQLLIGFASSESVALIGCSLTGAGFSLIFPALGVLAIKKVSPQMRGTALGSYAAFFDISLGIAGPVAGLIAGWFSYGAIYQFGAISGLLAILIVFLQKND